MQVRTARFKKWFGDWEAAWGVQQLETRAPTNLDRTAALADQKAVEDAFAAFGQVENAEDKRVVTFPKSMAGKIVRHKGFDVKRIAGAFNRLFENAVPMGSAPEEAKAGHKDHTSNVDGYHQYVSKFKLDGAEYYARFTVQKMHKAGNMVHSSFVSEVSVYDKGAASARYRVIDPVATEHAAPYDSKLAQWLAEGKGDGEVCQGKVEMSGSWAR
ncbi:hypothetical protein FACS189497_15510 [Betaproteobacteria bacterium]|nr:hypothetical protein FACS189497_15510 [Betaproteobacteria bacterium]